MLAIMILLDVHHCIVKIKFVVLSSEEIGVFFSELDTNQGIGKILSALIN